MTIPFHGRGTFFPGKFQDNPLAPTQSLFSHHPKSLSYPSYPQPPADFRSQPIDVRALCEGGDRHRGGLKSTVLIYGS